MTKAFGDAAIAAMRGQQYAMFLMCVGLGRGQLPALRCLQLPGQKIARVKKGLIFLVCFALCIGGISVTSMIFAEPIIAIFQKNAEVIEIGNFALRTYAFGMIFMAFSVPVNMLYQSASESRIFPLSFPAPSGAGYSFPPY